MRKFFLYNWKVRDEWLEWCTQLSEGELLQSRIGGAGGILYTLFHIVDVEYSWIRGIQGKEDVVMSFSEYHTLEQVKSLSDTLQTEIDIFLSGSLNALKEHEVRVPWSEGTYTVEDILHHIIVHEIHHIGQLSVWSRELKLPPVSADFIGREY